MFILIKDELLSLFESAVEDKDFIFWKTYKRLWAQYMKAHEIQEGRPRHHLKYDPIEDTDEYIKVECEVYREAKRIVYEKLNDSEIHVHYVAMMSEKRRILKEKYDIEWKSPIQMNPGVNID